MVAEVGLRGSLLDFENVANTVENIQNHPSTLRWALVLDMTMSSCDVIISILLGAILVVSGASATLSVTSMAFRLMQQAVLATNLMHMFAASILLDESLPVANVISALFQDNSRETRESLAFVFLVIHKYGYLLALIFFGISMGLHGHVIVVWGVFPKWIGYLLCISGLSYTLDSLLFFTKSGYNGEATGILMIPVLITEIGFAACLVLRKVTVADRRDS